MPEMWSGGIDMGWIEQAKCDGPRCTAVKKDGNHWFEAIIEQTTHEQGFGPILVTIWRMEVEQPHPERKTFCGAPCLLQTIQAALDDPGLVPLKE